MRIACDAITNTSPFGLSLASLLSLWGEHEPTYVSNARAPVLRSALPFPAVKAAACPPCVIGMPYARHVPLIGRRVTRAVAVCRGAVRRM